MILVIGSHAVNFRQYIRESNDLDLIGNTDEIINYIKSLGNIKTIYPGFNGDKLIIEYVKFNDNKISFCEANFLINTNKNLFESVQKDKNTIIVNNLIYPSLNVLYMLKMSHRFKKNSTHFLKTMDDIIKLKNLGCIIEPEYNDFFKLREKETYNYNHPNLNVSKKQFFNDSINYIYDHDWIHEIVAHLNKPAYKYYQTKEIYCSKDLFFSLDKKTQLYGVLEESYVLALERSQIPFQFNLSPKKSFDKALMKVCTNITSGWFREFAWNNYYSVQNLYSDEYIEKFKLALKSNNIKYHQK